MKDSWPGLKKNKQPKNPNPQNTLKAHTLRFKVNINSRLTPSLGLYCSADMAETIFRNETSVPGLLLKLLRPRQCTAYFLQ